MNDKKKNEEKEDNDYKNEKEGLGEWFDGLEEDEIPSKDSKIPTKENSKNTIDNNVEISTKEDIDDGKITSEMIEDVSSINIDNISKKEELEKRKQSSIYSTERGLTYYEVNIPNFSKNEKEIMKETKENAIEELEEVDIEGKEKRKKKEKFVEEIKKILEEKSLQKISNNKKEEMAKLIVREMIGFGMLDMFLEDKNLEEIMVIATKKPIYVYDREYGMCISNITYDNEDKLIHQIEKMGRRVGRRIDKQNPLLDATLPDGSRINATIPPISLDGPTLTIRKFREDPLTITDVIEYDTLSPDVAAFLWLAVEGYDGAKPSNILIAGGTASGKSTTLNILTSFCREKERLISIEDTAELNLPHDHWIRLETRAPNVEGKGEVTMNELVKNSLRMRPDRIIVGEVRGKEAMTMFTGMNTGHRGCMGTVHANSASETITRLTKNPMNVPQIMINALDAVVMQQRMTHHEKGQIRRITEIAELTGMEEGKPQLNSIYEWNAKKDKVVSTGVPSQIKREIANFAGVSGKEIEKEIKRRSLVLEWMREENINSIEEVGNVHRKYYKDKDEFLEEIKEKIEKKNKDTEIPPGE